MNKGNLLGVFNEQLSKFFDDIIAVFPNDKDIVIAYVSLMSMRKLNPKLIIGIWNSYIGRPYKEEIEKGNIDFFLNKDYSSDLRNNANADLIISKINVLREPIKKLGDDNLQKTVLYIQNLSKLSALYHSN